MNDRTIERCAGCDMPTGNAGEGEDSLFIDGSPWCGDCFTEELMTSRELYQSEVRELRGVIEDLRAEIQDRGEVIAQFVEDLATKDAELVEALEALGGR